MQLPPKMGRPKVDNPRVKIGVRIDPDLEKKLTAYCEAHGITRTQAIEQGIHLLLANEK